MAGFYVVQRSCSGDAGVEVNRCNSLADALARTRADRIEVSIDWDAVALPETTGAAPDEMLDELAEHDLLDVVEAAGEYLHAHGLDDRLGRCAQRSCREACGV